MNQLAILSRDAQHYSSLLRDAHLPDLAIIASATTWQDDGKMQAAHLILADPDLIAPHLAKCAELHWLQSTWAGVKPVLDTYHGAQQDIARQMSRILFTGVKDVFGAQMREYVFAYLLHYSRDVEGFAALQREQHWRGTEPGSLAGKTLGIMGVGSIGKAVASAAKAFDMRVWGLTHSSRDCVDVDHYFTIKDKLAFAEALDYVVCLLPHTDATEHLVDAAFLSQLPEHAVIINAGRGQVIDDDALMDALDEQRIRAAVLDVFKEEPLPLTHPYWQSDRVHITQHTAAISRPSDIVNLFVDNYHRYHAQQPLHYQIDWHKGY